MKFFNLAAEFENTDVTPLVGVWIEIKIYKNRGVSVEVTLLVGVWIEIDKSYCHVTDCIVTPLVGVWIEIKEIVVY